MGCVITRTWEEGGSDFGQREKGVSTLKGWHLREELRVRERQELGQLRLKLFNAGQCTIQCFLQFFRHFNAFCFASFHHSLSLSFCWLNKSQERWWNQMAELDTPPRVVTYTMYLDKYGTWIHLKISGMIFKHPVRTPHTVAYCSCYSIIFFLIF